MKTKTIILIVVIILLAVAGFLLGARLLTGEDSWICQNGEWVKHGQPKAAKPTKSCGGATNASAANLNINSNVNTDTASQLSGQMIQVTKPQNSAIIISPLVVSGRAKGSWYFEALFPVRLINDQGQVLASGSALAEADWMTEDWVPFKVTLQFSAGQAAKGTLIFSRSNPSDLAAKIEEFQVPVRFR